MGCGVDGFSRSLGVCTCRALCVGAGVGAVVAVAVGAVPVPHPAYACRLAPVTMNDSSYVLQNNDGTGGECVPSKHAVGGRFIDENFILRVRCGGVPSHAAYIPPAMLLPLETW